MAGLTIGVVGHRSRVQRAIALAYNMQAVAINIDDGTLGCAGNHQVVLGQLDGSDWCCVLEEDAVPADQFREHLQRALSCAPAPIVGLYLGTGNPSGEVQIQIRQAVVTAQEQGQAWILGDCLIGSVGYAIRTDLRDDLLSYIWDRHEELPLRISRWAQCRGISIAYTAPSLVDHEDLDTVDGPDLRSERKAWWFGSRPNWDTTTVPLGHCPGWSAE